MLLAKLSVICKLEMKQSCNCVKILLVLVAVGIVGFAWIMGGCNGVVGVTGSDRYGIGLVTGVVVGVVFGSSHIGDVDSG